MLRYRWMTLRYSPRIRHDYLGRTCLTRIEKAIGVNFGDRDMTNETKAQPQAKPDLNSHYRPLGLKAVAAAALMLKRKPAAKPA